MSRILFVAYGGGHVAALVPIFLATQRAGHDPVFLALTTAKAALESLQIESLGFRDLPDSQLPEVRTYGTELLKTLAGGPVDHDESVAYLGLNFRDLVAASGEPAAREAYGKRGRQIFLPVATLKRAIEWLEPDLVVATSAPRAERAAILAAGELGVRSLCIADLYCIAESEWVGKSNYATRVAVLNEWVRDLLLRCGRSKSDVIVTGNPAFDTLTSEVTINAGRSLRSERHWTDGRFTILWASQQEPTTAPVTGTPANAQLPREIESALRHLVSRFANFRLVVRYHPSERVAFTPSERVELSPRSESLDPLLHAVDAVVVMTSTVGIQAHIAGKPVVAVRGSVYDAVVPFGDFGIATMANGPADLESALRSIADKSQSTGFVPTQDAHRIARRTATERVMDIVESLIQ